MAAFTESQRSALQWIVATIEKHMLPYQIVGGLAAIAHGGTRPLNDIDLYLPLKDAAAFLQDVRPYVVWGPETVVEGQWDITYLKLVYQGQKIEIGDSAGPRICDGKTGMWITKNVDFFTSENKDVFGCTIQVIPLDQLIAYKRILAREVDRNDVEELVRNRPSGHS